MLNFFQNEFMKKKQGGFISEALETVGKGVTNNKESNDPHAYLNDDLKKVTKAYHASGISPEKKLKPFIKYLLGGGAIGAAGVGGYKLKQYIRNKKKKSNTLLNNEGLKVAFNTGMKDSLNKYLETISPKKKKEQKDLRALFTVPTAQTKSVYGQVEPIKEQAQGPDALISPDEQM